MEANYQISNESVFNVHVFERQLNRKHKKFSTVLLHVISSSNIKMFSLQNSVIYRSSNIGYFNNLTTYKSINVFIYTEILWMSFTWQMNCNICSFSFTQSMMIIFYGSQIASYTCNLLHVHVSISNTFYIVAYYFFYFLYFSVSKLLVILIVIIDHEFCTLCSSQGKHRMPLCYY